MKVLLINPTFGGVSGSGRHVKLLYERLKDKVEFEVWNVKNIGFINLPKLKTISFYLKCKLKKIPDDVDIIHVHNSKLAGIIPESKASILTIHGSYEEELEIQYGSLIAPVKWYIKRNLRNANAITCVDPYTADRMNWIWIPNMVDLESIKTIKRVEGEPKLVWIGRDDPVKNHELFRLIAKEAYKRFNVKSLVLGIRRGKYREHEWINYERVPWEMVISHLKNSYALVVTSKIEGLPSTILEAWASECPVIAPPIKSLSMLNKLFGEVIKLTENYEVESFLRYIKLAIDGKLVQIIKKSKEVVSSKFDSRVVSEEYLSLYHEILNRVKSTTSQGA